MLSLKTGLLTLTFAAVLQGGVKADNPAPLSSRAPQTVVDYYYLLPCEHFEFEQGQTTRPNRPERRSHLKLSQDQRSGVVDISNGYMGVKGDGAQGDIFLCIFKRPDKTYLAAAIGSRQDSTGTWRPALKLYIYEGAQKRLVEIPASRFGIPEMEGIERIVLPRYGRTIRMWDETRTKLVNLTWKGDRFQIQRPFDKE
jgi:hypothetical protein